MFTDAEYRLPFVVSWGECVPVSAGLGIKRKHPNSPTFGESPCEDGFDELFFGEAFKVVRVVCEVDAVQSFLVPSDTFVGIEELPICALRPKVEEELFSIQLSLQ